MSLARATYMNEINALSSAVLNSSVGTGATLFVDLEGAVLRRGAAITGQIMLESFVRERVEEVLEKMQSWPAGYDDLPRRFQDRAIIEALSNIEKYARMIKRVNGNYRTEVVAELGKLTSISAPNLQFTKFVAGDYTGNLSDSNLQSLLGDLQVKDCWRRMQVLSTDIGFGVPSVQEVLRSVVNNRHRSAHVSGFSPSAVDVLELPQNLRLIGICVDAALTASIQCAVNNWRRWVADDFDWLKEVVVYFLLPQHGRYRFIEKSGRRALRICEGLQEAREYLPKRNVGKVRLLVQLGGDGRPAGWDVA